MLSQQATTGPALIKGVERTNVIAVQEQKQRMEAPRRNPYVIEMDRGRNCYTCGEFGHMAHHYRKRGRAMEEKRVEYEEGSIERNLYHLNNLKAVENLKFLD